MKADVLGVGEIEVEFDVTFSGDQLSRLEKGQDYQIFVHLQKNGQTVDTGSKTKVVLDVNVYDKNADVFGLFGVDRHEQFKHDNDYVDLSSIGTTNAKVDVEEGLLTMGYFWLDLSLGAVLDALNFRLATYNTVTGDTGILRTVSLDLSDQFIVDGSQQIVLDTKRGFILKDNDQFNYLKINTDVKIGDKQYYEVLVGWKTPYQTWVEYLQADPIFHDKTKPFNNLNEFAANYSNLNDYQLRTFIDADVSNGESITTYRDSSENISVWGYDEDDQGDPDTYTCDVNTYGEDGTVYEKKIIKSGFTEVKGEFIPAVQPVFSTNLDFTDVSVNYTRFAHANLTPPGRSGVWANNQANDVDTFNGASPTPTYTKLSVPYGSTVTTITTPVNGSCLYGMFNPEKNEYYSVKGEMYSDEFDDDSLGFVVAFNTDQNGLESSIILVATTGGQGFSTNGRNPAYVNGDTDKGIFEGGDGIPVYALVYNWGKEDSKTLGMVKMNIAESGFTWGDAAVGDMFFEVSRSGNDITCNCDWTINGVQYTTPITYSLGTDSVTEKFYGSQSFGFSFFSQDTGGFKNVILSIPQDDYYGILRILPENAVSDSAKIELSSIREAPSDNLLIQKDGVSVLATLSWDGNKFIVQGVINQAVLDSNINYILSAQIKKRVN